MMRSNALPLIALRILIVDDNVDAAETMAILLQCHGHETRVAFTGTEAVSVSTTFVPEVVLLDINLPELDGYEVARRIRLIPEMKHAFLVALTGYASETDRRRANDSGFDEHLPKPVDLEILRKWLGAITLRKSSP